MKSQAMGRARYRSARLQKPGTVSFWAKRPTDEHWRQYAHPVTIVYTRGRGMVEYLPRLVELPDAPETGWVFGLSVESGVSCRVLPDTQST